MSQYNPLVTIVIPVYNGTNFMRDAIDCALAQSYRNIEIIVVNDGSTDDGATDSVAKTYGNRIKYYNKTNGGVSSALNLAISNMKGDWFSWLSHDDLYYPNKIEKQVEFIRRLQENNRNIDLNKIVVHCATESIDKNGRVIKRPSYKDIPEKENSIDVILNNVYNYRLSGCSFLIPSKAFSEIGMFREDIRTVSDVEFWYRLLFSGYHFYCMSNDILVQNRSHGKQVGKTRVRLFNKELNELHISIADRLFSNPNYANGAVFERYYFGLVKRNIQDAAIYTKEKYIKQYDSKLRYYIVIPGEALCWSVVGNIRMIVRNLYRKIMVK